MCLLHNIWTYFNTSARVKFLNIVWQFIIYFVAKNEMQLPA